MAPLRLLAAFSACALVSTPAAAVQEVRDLGPAEEEATEALTRIESVRVLADGSVLVADPVERAVYRISLETGERAVLGRSGQGPQEYLVPSMVLAWPGDSTLVFDQGQSRYLVLDPSGVPARTFRLGSAAAAVQSATPRATDALGRIYVAEFDGGNFALTPGMRRDRSRLYRVGPGGERAEVVASLVRPENVDRPVGRPFRTERGMTQVLIIMPTPWAHRDGWAVDADGTPWVFRSGDSPALEGGTRAAHALDLEPSSVSDQDRERYLAGWKEDQRAQGEGDYVEDITADEIEWPARKAPFVGGMVRLDPSGHLWLRVTDLEAARPVYAVVDAMGRVQERACSLNGHAQIRSAELGKDGRIHRNHLALEIQDGSPAPSTGRFGIVDHELARDLADDAAGGEWLDMTASPESASGFPIIRLTFAGNRSGDLGIGPGQQSPEAEGVTENEHLIALVGSLRGHAQIRNRVRDPGTAKESDVGLIVRRHGLDAERLGQAGEEPHEADHRRLEAIGADLDRSRVELPGARNVTVRREQPVGRYEEAGARIQHLEDRPVAVERQKWMALRIRQGRSVWSDDPAKRAPADGVPEPVRAL